MFLFILIVFAIGVVRDAPFYKEANGKKNVLVFLSNWLIFQFPTFYLVKEFYPSFKDAYIMNYSNYSIFILSWTRVYYYYTSWLAFACLSSSLWEQ